MDFFKILAKKMTVLYKLAKEQLSKQYHYDFGLRALKSVLVMAGELKRGSTDLAEVKLALFIYLLIYFFITHLVDKFYKCHIFMLMYMFVY